MKRVWLFLAAFLALTSGASAGLSVNVIPLDGSTNLRLDQEFTRLGEKKEVRVRISSTGSRYQVFQRVQGLITNEKGETLNMLAVLAQALPNSNASGTLYAQNLQPLGLGDELLYSSAQGGQSDSFIVGYALRPELLNADGSFSGRVVFTARAPGEPDSQAAVDIFVRARSNLKVSVTGSRSANRVHIADTDNEQNADFVKVSFSGSNGQEIRVYQEIVAPFQSSEGQQMDAGLIKIEAISGKTGTKPPDFQKSRQLIYAGRENEDAFELHFLVDRDKLIGQQPGDYAGRVKYIVETGAGQLREFPLDLDFRIQPMFTMEIIPPAEGLKFGPVLPSNPPQAKEFIVRVQSNLRKPYQVMQNLQSPMANERGMEFDPQYFTFRVDIPKNERGKTKFDEFTPVPTGEHPVFFSDSKGSPVTFRVVYKMQGYQQMNSGQFAAPIRFSLNQN